MIHWWTCTVILMSCRVETKENAFSTCPHWCKGKCSDFCKGHSSCTLKLYCAVCTELDVFIYSHVLDGEGSENGGKVTVSSYFQENTKKDGARISLLFWWLLKLVFFPRPWLVSQSVNQRLVVSLQMTLTYDSRYDRFANSRNSWSLLLWICI